MTRLITTIGIIITIIALCICGVFYTKNTKVQFIELIDTAIEQCENNDINGLKESTKKMSAFFESRHSFLSFFIRHDEIEKIETDIINLSGYTNISSFHNAQISLNHLKFMINHIYKNEIPNMENLF